MNESETSSSSNPAAEGFRISEQPVVPGNGRSASGNGALKPSEADLLYVIARDPRSLFVYWDLNWKRVFEKAGVSPCQVHLRIYRENGAVEGTHEINPFRGHHYADVAAAGTGYFCELGCLKDDEWTGLVRSGKAATPEDQMSDDFSTDFASLPLHLSFQRMLELVRASHPNDATLANSVAELQEKAQAGGNGEPSSEIRELLQAPAVTTPPTAEEIAQWRRLGEELGRKSWGGASGGGFGGSSQA